MNITGLDHAVGIHLTRQLACAAPVPWHVANFVLPVNHMVECPLGRHAEARRVAEPILAGLSAEARFLDNVFPIHYD